MAKHNEIGILGERIAVKFLISKRIYYSREKFSCERGEIDIIATKIKKKGSFSYETKRYSLYRSKTKKLLFLEIKDNVFAPENNLTKSKRQRLLKAIRHYLSYRKINEVH